ncbi:hypothetical protein [Haloferax sulfurifontis]|uniref:Uncharacterized protein n=1 Tax=Haloferax sulfurifontis TaxID=255616 RepID=A0A830DPM4_9EURY|nr:hypothetical protein [Haloferax sulfurifontis]GGC52394.1 hypothetical protein GCM10007209_12580 [Haloferax sulfurifontis]
MSDAPGIPKVAFLFWVIFGGLLTAQGLIHGVAMLPVVTGAYFIEPTTLPFVVFAGFGWVLYHAVDSVNIIARLTDDQLQYLVQQLEKEGLGKVGIASAIYVNVVVGFGALIGYAIATLSGVGVIGILIAVIYPNADLRYGLRYPTPGAISLKLTIKILHAFGILRNVSAESVLSGLVPDLTPRDQTLSP